MTRLTLHIVVWLCVAVSCGCGKEHNTSPTRSENAVPYTTLVERDGLLFEADGKTVYSGVCHSFYDKGQKRDEIHVSEGRRHGLMTIWHTNGQVFRKVHFEHGEKTGKQTEWSEGGEVWSEVSFKAGKKHGLEIYWHKNGTKSRETRYRDGEKHGLEVRWYENGQKMLEKNWKQGKVHGWIRAWYRDGKMRGEREFDEGVPIKAKAEQDAPSNGGQRSSLKSSFHPRRG